MPLEPPGTYLGTLQILQDADGAIFLFRHPAQAGDIARVLGMRAVGKIQPRYIHPHPHQIAEHGLAVARWADGADNLGAPGGPGSNFRGELSGSKIQLTWFQILPIAISM
jgi:hypothetical protein